MLGHALAQKRGDIGCRRQILKLRQAGKIKFRLGFAFSDGRGGCVRIWSRLVTVRLLRLLFALRPARQKALALVAMILVAHAPPFRPGGPSVASCLRSALVRSRLRLWNARSTWNSSTKAAIHDAMSGDIGTVPITSQPLSNIASPSVGSAVTFVT